MLRRPKGLFKVHEDEPYAVYLQRVLFWQHFPTQKTPVKTDKKMEWLISVSFVFHHILLLNMKCHRVLLLALRYVVIPY